MTDYDITEIADAKYMGLMCPPASPEARALVIDIINIIKQAEQRQRARKAKDKTAFRSAVGLISISKGRNAQAPQFDEGAAPSYHPSLATRFRPTQVMVSMADETGVRHGSARKHFPQQLLNNHLTTSLR